MEREAEGVTFDADFDNGSMDRMVRLGVNWYHLMLRPDTSFFFHFRVRGGQGREIIFEFAQQEKTSNAQCPLSGRKPPAAAARPSWPQPCEAKPYVSYDGRTWSPVDHMEQDFRFPRTFRFTHRFAADEAFVCCAHPYKHGDMKEWLATIEEDPRVEVGSLGESRNGVDQPLLTITGDRASRDLVVLIAREDSDEPLGSWGIEGVVRRLLAEESKGLLQRYTFKIAPMVCVDGVIAGATHSAGYGYGGWRWHEEPAPAEIENVKRALRGWIGGGYRLKLAGKLHSGHALLPTQEEAANSQNVLTSSPEIRDALTRHTDECWIGKVSDLQIRPLGYFERFLLDTFGLSHTFATHIQGATPENARRCGEGLMQNIAAWLMEQT